MNIQRWFESVVGCVTSVVSPLVPTSTPCTGNPPGLPPDDAYNDSHDWYEFDHAQYKCTECGLVIGWPDDDKRERMGLERRTNDSPLQTEITINTEPVVRP